MPTPPSLPFPQPPPSLRRENEREDGRVNAEPAIGESTDIATAASVSRAMDLLERSAVAAERGVLEGGGLPPAPRAGFCQAAKLDAPAVRLCLDRVVMGPDPESGLDALLACGALDALFPDVYAMVGFGDGEWRHKDVWKHTKQVVRQAVPRLEVRWAALFHDIGKVKTRSISPEGKVHFLGHAEVGTRMFDKLERRQPLFSNEPRLQSTVRFLILHHLRANQYEPTWTDSAVRRFARELGEHVQDLLCLAQADITTKRPEKRKKGLGQISELTVRLQKLAAEDAQVPPLPTGIGNAIAEAFALRPSPRIGEIKRLLELDVARGEIAPNLPVADYVVYVKSQRERFGL